MEDLAERFGVDGLVSVGAGRNDRPFVRLTAAATAASAAVYLFGAHVTSWSDNSGRSRLFLSESAVFNGEKAIRGGIPVCFPQFGKSGPLQAHGFARNTKWEIEATGADHDGEDPWVRLKLGSTERTREQWPHDFELRLTVTLAVHELGALHCELTVTNTGAQAFDFTTALHAYFLVDSASAAAVEGLRGLQYIDQVDGDRRKTEEHSTVSFHGEVDRVYLSAPEKLSLQSGDAALYPSLQIVKHTFADAVVWNPHVAKSRTMADLESGAWRHFVCVEAGSIGKPVTMPAGQTWRAGVRLRPLVRPS